MKHKLLIICLLVSGFSGISQERSPRINTVTFQGEGYELGLKHGEYFKEEIAQLINLWKKDLEKNSDRKADSMIAAFIKYANFEEAIKKWTPELYEEVKGIAAGSKQSFNDILTMNLLDEFWAYEFDLQNHHCTSMGVPEQNGQPAYIAQNMDLESFTDGFQTLIRLVKTNNRPEQLILTYPGLIALNGLNEKGIGVCVNTLITLKSSNEGLPVAFIVRRILNTTNPEEVLNFIKTTAHASGQNYILGIKDKVYDFEASANKVVQYNPSNANGAVFHANMPMENDDRKKVVSMGPQDTPLAEFLEKDSKLRFEALNTRMQAKSKITDAMIMDGLRSRDHDTFSVCVENDGYGVTFASTIMTLTGTPFLQVAPGPPNASTYQKFDFLSQ